MADIRFNNEYCLVLDNDTDEVIIAEKLTARVETGHKIYKYKGLEDIPVDKLPVLSIGEVQEDNKLYVKDGIIVCKENIKIIDEKDIVNIKSK